MTLELVLLIFAVYRVANMLAIEDGAFDLFARWRDWIGVDRQSTWVQRGFGCPACLSFWISAVAAALMTVQHGMTILDFGILWIGIAGATLAVIKIAG